MKIAVFASGNGSNFQILAEQFPDQVKFVFSDHHDAYVLERAERLGVAKASLELKEFSSEEEYVPRSIQYIVVHCSATRANIPFTEEQLLKCHLQRGFKCIGYHFYITRDGELHHCRPVSEPGAHVRGFNRHSIGICYEGGLDENGYPADTRTQAQRFTLLDLLTILRHQYPKAQILGHYQLSASIHKACPCFDCRKEYAEL